MKASHSNFIQKGHKKQVGCPQIVVGQNSGAYRKTTIYLDYFLIDKYKPSKIP